MVKYVQLSQQSNSHKHTYKNQSLVPHYNWLWFTSITVKSVTVLSNYYETSSNLDKVKPTTYSYYKV